MLEVIGVSEGEVAFKWGIEEICELVGDSEWEIAGDI